MFTPRLRVEFTSQGLSVVRLGYSIKTADMIHRIFMISCVVLLGKTPSVFPQDLAPAVKVSMPTIPKRPRFFFLESPNFSLLIHHGEGELSDDGSLVINGYKNDPVTPNPIDLWIFGTVLNRQGELQSVVLTKFAEQCEELVIILFFKYRGMDNATVLLYRPESHGLQVVKELEDLGTMNSVETVRLRCSRDLRIAKYFPVPKAPASPAVKEPAKQNTPEAAKESPKERTKVPAK